MPRVLALSGYSVVALCMAIMPAQAQTTFGGVLERIEVARSSACAGASLDVYAPAPSVTFTHTNDCGGSSTILEITANFPMATPSARQGLQEAIAGALTFDAGLTSTFNAKATYFHGSSSGSTLWWGFPATEQGCLSAVTSHGPAIGVWTASLTAGCTRNLKQSLVRDSELGTLYFTPWAEVHSDLLPGTGSAGGVLNSFSLQVRAWYRMLPAVSDNAAIAIATPASGKRQDPNGQMQAVQASVDYELGSADDAMLLLVAEDEKGNPLSAGVPVPVVRGKGTMALSLAGFTCSPHVSEIAVTARLLAPGTQKVLGQSEAVRYPMAAELRADHLEVIQVVQDGSNGVPLAANRPTWLRLFGYAEELDFFLDGVAWQVRGFRDGHELEGSPILAAPLGNSIGLGVDRLEDEGVRTRIPQSWTAAGVLELRAEINPAGVWHLNEVKTSDNTYTQKVTFQERPPLRILNRLVCVEPPGEDSACPWGGHDGVKMQHIFGLYPVQEGRTSYERIPVPPLRWKEPMRSLDSWERLLQELALLDDLSPGFAATYQQMIGWLPPEARATLPDGGSRKIFPLPVANGGTGRVLLAAERNGEESAESESLALAHEMGHNLGLGHPYPQPPCDETNAGLLTGEFNQLFGAFLSPRTFELMSQCSESAGITPTQYRSLWQGGFQPAGRTTAPVTDGATGRCLLVQGRVWRQSLRGQLDRILPVDCATTPAPVPSGNYCLLYSNQSSESLGQWCFPVSFILPETDTLLDDRSFYVKAPMPDGLWGVSLLSANQPLATRRASKAAPVVRFIEPHGGDRWMDGAVDLIWSGSDADGDSLLYVLSYSYDDGATWIAIAADLTGTRYSLDLKEIQGGKNLRFRITASDGLLTSTAESGPVEVVQVPLVQVAPDTLEFPGVAVGRQWVQRLAVGNSGSGPLNIRSITTTGPFRVKEAAPMRIAAGVTRFLTVEFLPQQSGVFPGTLTVVSDDETRPSVEVVLIGLSGP